MKIIQLLTDVIAAVCWSLALHPTKHCCVFISYILTVIYLMKYVNM